MSSSGWNQLGSTINISGEGQVLLSNDGKTLAIKNRGKKKVEVYKFLDDTWNNESNIDSSNTGFGKSVSLSSDGKILAVSSDNYVIVYEWDGYSWVNKSSIDFSNIGLKS